MVKDVAIWGQYKLDIMKNEQLDNEKLETFL